MNASRSADSSGTSYAASVSNRNAVSRNSSNSLAKSISFMFGQFKPLAAVDDGAFARCARCALAAESAQQAVRPSRLVPSNAVAQLREERTRHPHRVFAHGDVQRFPCFARDGKSLHDEVAVVGFINR